MSDAVCSWHSLVPLLFPCFIHIDWCFFPPDSVPWFRFRQTDCADGFCIQHKDHTG